MELVIDSDLTRRSIVHHCPETGVYVFQDKTGQWTVFRPESSRTVCYNDSTYVELSLAVARCDYIARRLQEKGA